MILCKDCKYINELYCEHDESLNNIDIVTGIRSYNYCIYMRDDNYPCKKESILFEPNLFYKIKRMLMLCRKS